jgi:hypothetical protein
MCSCAALDDQTLLALYTKFQKARHCLGTLYSQARYDDFLDRGRYQGIALPVPVIAQEHMLEAANTLNRLNYDLHSITASSKVFELITDAEKMQAVFEFLFPIVSHSLSAPYSLKQMFIKSTYQISHHTSRFWDSNRDPRSFKERVNFRDAGKLARRFASWPTLSAALSVLNNDNFTEASDDYRNRFNHGFPRRIEFGHTTTVQTEPPGSFSYVWRNAPPFLIGDLIPLLSAQYNVALTAYKAYIELIKEQETLWPSVGARESV